MSTGKITCRSKYIEWNLGGFSSLLERKNAGICSPDFDFAGTPWNLGIGYRRIKGESEWISMELYNSNGFEICISGGIGIKRDDGTVYISHSFDQHNFKNDSRHKIIHHFARWSTLRADMQVIAPSNEATFFCWIGSIDERCERCKETMTETSEIEGIQKLSQDFKNVYLDGKDSDTTIKVADREFQAHRLILGARSPVFASMYSHDTTEKRTGIVEIEDCDPEAFQDFLIFLYSGKMESISSKNVLGLYAAGDKYDVKDLKQMCLRFMKSNFSVENFCDFMVLALKYNESELLNSATDFFVKNAKKIAATSEWLCFQRDYSVESNELCLKVFHLYNPN